MHKPTPRLTPLLFVLAGSIALSAEASVIYVRATAGGANNGTSWSDAYTDLQSALTAARSGDQVWIAAGVYRPAPPNGPRTRSFVLRTGIAWYGGFAGTETHPDQRDLTAHVTELSGDLNDNDPDFNDNSCRVVRVITAADPGVLMDGLTICDGNSDRPSASLDVDGAGLLMNGGLLSVRNCIFRDNSAGKATAALLGRDGGSGGAARFEQAQVEFINCRFENNRAGDGQDNVATEPPGNGGDGGAIEGFGGTLAFTNCTFVGNRAGNGGFAPQQPGGTGGDGGAIKHAGTLVLQSCVFTDNHAGDGQISGIESQPPGSGGSGGAAWINGSATIGGGSFAQNRSGGGTPGSGGAIHFYSSNFALSGVDFSENAGADGVQAGGSGGAISVWSSPNVARLVDCTFTRNRAGSASGTAGVNQAGSGGAVAFEFAILSVERCVFLENRAGDCGGEVSTAGSGGALRGAAATILRSVFQGNHAGSQSTPSNSDGWGGALRLSGPSTVVSSVFANNQTHGVSGTGHGGAIQTSSHLTLVNCTLSRNAATGRGGGLAIQTNLPWLDASNCIFWENTDLGGADETAQIDGFTANDQINYSIVQGFSGMFGGEHNLALDPRFLDAGAGNLQLSPGSPAIDAGNNASVPPSESLDVLGNPRFVDDPGTTDSGAGTAPIVDLGAFEFQPCSADLDGDHDVDLADLTMLLAQFGASGSNPADIDSNGRVDLADLTAVLSQFGQTCP